MQRVKRATAVAVLPAAPSGGTPGYFAAPDPQSGVPATVPGHEWFNGMQEEVMAVIEGQGLSGSSSDHTLLRQAITKMIQSGQRSVVINNAVFAVAVTGTGKPVYWDAGNNRFDLALADGTAKQNCVGFADVPNSQVYCFGDTVLFAGLTPGSRYYLDGTTAGAIATTPPANGMYLGIARTATEIFVDIDTLGVQANSANAWTKGQRGVPVAFPATTGTVTLDLAAGNNHEGTLTGNIVLANPSSMPVGQSGMIRPSLGAVPFAVSYGSYWKPADGLTLPALTALAYANDGLVYYVESSTRILVGKVGGSV